MRLPSFSFLALFIIPFFIGEERFVIRSKVDKFGVDAIGNVYIINGEELVKYNPSAKILARYSNLKLGQITSMDLTNPLKILLYYRDYQQLVYLDDQLSANADPISLE